MLLHFKRLWDKLVSKVSSGITWLEYLKEEVVIANLDAAKEAVGVWMLLSHVTSSSSSDTKLQDVENVRSDPPLQNAAAKN